MNAKRMRVLLSALPVLLFAAGGAGAEEAHVAPVTDYVKANVVPWLADPEVVEAVKAQNAAEAGLSDADIEAKDKAWRAETEAAEKPMIEAVLANSLSKFLMAKKDASAGLITEIFVTDAKGLNVGQSDPTSDYWQGDEAKWQKTFQVGPGAIFVDEVEKDESTQMLQSQVSATIVDPATGAAIGAVTLGINVEQL